MKFLDPSCLHLKTKSRLEFLEVESPETLDKNCTSVLKDRNNRGPNTDSCGTPEIKFPHKQNIKKKTLTPARLLEVRAAVPQLQTRVVAVARLVVQVLDDGVDGGLLDDTGRVPPRTAQLRLPARAALRETDAHGDDRQQRETTRDADECHGARNVGRTRVSERGVRAVGRRDASVSKTANDGGTFNVVRAAARRDGWRWGKAALNNPMRVRVRDESRVID